MYNTYEKCSHVLKRTDENRRKNIKMKTKEKNEKGKTEKWRKAKET